MWISDTRDSSMAGRYMMADRSEFSESLSVNLNRRPVFIQAMWRTGSTYVWKKFRDQSRYRAYYEPLHECLVQTREQVEASSGADKQVALRHPGIDKFYFAEYPFSQEGGVEYFRKPLSYERYCLQENEKDEDLRKYVGNLIDHAAKNGQTAALQFNRGLLRAGWLAKNFSPIQILVLRNPLDVWKSFLRFPGHPFETYVCTVLGQNREKAPLSRLPRWLDIPCEIHDTFAQEFPVYTAFAAANKELLYPLFFDFYLLSIIHCAQFADCILDLDGISQDPSLRARATVRLRELGIEMNLDDCTLPRYAPEASDKEWAAYEQFGSGFLERRLRPTVSISASKFELHRPLLSGYFRTLLSRFVEPQLAGLRDPVVPAEDSRNAKHMLAVRLFENREFQAASNLLGAALADGETGELWNDWATAQNACARPRLAELGFRQALRSEWPDREAAGSLGVLLFEKGRFREALPLLQEAELAVDAKSRPIVSKYVNRAREVLKFSEPEAKQTEVLTLPPRSEERPRGTSDSERLSGGANESRKGFTIFLTGLSGAGKSTIANLLLERLAKKTDRPVILLDGDNVRKHLSPELGFSKEDRDLNIRRIGFVASQVTRCGGIAICAPIAPYDAVRKEVRELIEVDGGFCLVHVATPLAVCEQRDPKGLYAKARAGLVPQFTGVSDPYEVPADADIRIDTTHICREYAAQLILSFLSRNRFLDGERTPIPEAALAGAK